MDTRIYNIDSSLITTKTASNNFTYSTVTTVNRDSYSTTVNEPFNEKNVIEINILSIELPPVVSDVEFNTTPNPDPNNAYFFLRINDFGNIINRNIRYVAKIALDYTNPTTPYWKLITNRIKLEQPTDVKYLQISLEDNLGNLVTLKNGQGNLDFSFTLEVDVITNAILKDYDQIKFYSEPVMKRILESKMLAFYEKQVGSQVNNSLTGAYNANLVNLNNIMEYTPNGQRGNYNFIKPSYFTNVDDN
jgi:hypothetical protein